MSYNIIRGIKIDKNAGEVWIKAASNNLYPHRFDWEESGILSELLKEKGKTAVQREILLAYWKGDLQGGNNAYEKTILIWGPSFPYTWGNTGSKKEVGTTKRGETVIKYSYDRVKEALFGCYMAYINRDKTIPYVLKSGEYEDAYIKRSTKQKSSLASISEARVFPSFLDACAHLEKYSYLKERTVCVPLRK